MKIIFGTLILVLHFAKVCPIPTTGIWSGFALIWAYSAMFIGTGFIVSGILKSKKLKSFLLQKLMNN